MASDEEEKRIREQLEESRKEINRAVRKVEKMTIDEAIRRLEK